MKTIKILKDYTENDGNITILSSLAGVEVSTHNVELVLSVLQTTTFGFKSESEKLRAENEMLKSENKDLFSENYNLKSKIIRLEVEIEKLEFIISLLEEERKKGQPNNSYEKNIAKESELSAEGNIKIGDDVISGNQTVQINHNYFGQPPKTNTGLNTEGDKI